MIHSYDKLKHQTVTSDNVFSVNLFIKQTVPLESSWLVHFHSFTVNKHSWLLRREKVSSCLSVSFVRQMRGTYVCIAISWARQQPHESSSLSILIASRVIILVILLIIFLPVHRHRHHHHHHPCARKMHTTIITSITFTLHLADFIINNVAKLILIALVMAWVKIYTIHLVK